MPEPDGPNTHKQLVEVARTRFYERLMLAGLSAQQVDGMWERLDAVHQHHQINQVRALVNTANAEWGSHVRRHQSRLVREAGSSLDTAMAIETLMDEAETPREFAHRLMDLLGLSDE